MPGPPSLFQRNLFSWEMIMYLWYPEINDQGCSWLGVMAHGNSRAYCRPKAQGFCRSVQWSTIFMPALLKHPNWAVLSHGASECRCSQKAMLVLRFFVFMGKNEFSLQELSLCRIILHYHFQSSPNRPGQRVQPLSKCADNPVKTSFSWSIFRGQRKGYGFNHSAFSSILNDLDSRKKYWSSRVPWNLEPYSPDSDWLTEVWVQRKKIASFLGC